MNVVVRPRAAYLVDLDVSADEWQLFTFYSRVEAELLAKRLNQEIVTAVNGGMSRDQVQVLLGKMMRDNAHLGADDSEPHWMLQNILDSVYGEED